MFENGIRPMELRPKDYGLAYGDPDAKKQKDKRPRIVGKYVENGIRYEFYSPGPYRTNAQLLRGPGKATSKHRKVPVTPSRCRYADERYRPSDGNDWVRPAHDDNNDVIDPRAVIWAGGGEKVRKPESDFNDWKKIWTRNYTKFVDPAGSLYESEKVKIRNPNKRHLSEPIRRLRASEFSACGGATVFSLKQLSVRQPWPKELTLPRIGHDGKVVFIQRRKPEKGEKWDIKLSLFSPELTQAIAQIGDIWGVKPVPTLRVYHLTEMPREMRPRLWTAFEVERYLDRWEWIREREKKFSAGNKWSLRLLPWINSYENLMLCASEEEAF
jgi:hypothetical protein